LQEIGLYFAERNLEVAKRFSLAIERSIEFLLESPGCGEKHNYFNPAYADIRIWQVSGFSNYLIFYRFNATHLTIVRVLHGARDYAAMFNEE
jgi:toxin ParE1/3/4